LVEVAFRADANPLVSQPQVSIHALGRDPFILPSPDLGAGLYSQIVSFFQQTSFTPSVGQEAIRLFILFGGLGLLMQTWGIQFLTRKFELTSILFLALFIRGMSFILMPIWSTVFYFVAVSILYSIFNSLVQPMINTLLSLNAKPKDQGTVMGINSSYLSISNAFGPVIAGMLIHQSNPTTYAHPLYLAGGLTFLVLLLAVFTRRRYVVKVEPKS